MRLPLALLAGCDSGEPEPGGPIVGSFTVNEWTYGNAGENGAACPGGEEYLDSRGVGCSFALDGAALGAPSSATFLYRGESYALPAEVPVTGILRYDVRYRVVDGAVTVTFLGEASNTGTRYYVSLTGTLTVSVTRAGG